MTDHPTFSADPRLQPQARYILPSFIEHSSFGIKESNPYNKLFEERIIFLGVQVDDASANDIMAQLTATSPCTSTRRVARSPR
jgi:ATP-dependent Clp protease protease subunit